MKYKKLIVLGDTHIPYLDQGVHKAIVKFLTAFKPDKVILVGDIIDLWQISKFDKDPSRANTMQDDIDKTYGYLTELRDTLPKAKIIYMYGNHEDRFTKYLWREAEKLWNLRNIKFHKLLGLDTLKIKHYDRSNDIHREGELLFTHGTLVSQDSAMTARRMLKKYGMSVIHGHTHRLGSYYETKLGGFYGAWENGCLCVPELAREWRMGFPNWQQGMSVVYMTSKRFLVKPIFISEGEFLVEGELYK